MVASIEAAVRHGEDTEPRQRNRTALVPEPALLQLRLDRRRERPDRRVERRWGRQQEQRQHKYPDHDPSIFARFSPTLLELRNTTRGFDPSAVDRRDGKIIEAWEIAD